jgi:hypothetical protein
MSHKSADELRELLYGTRRHVAQRCIEILETHRRQWIEPSEGAAPVPIASHALYLVIEAIEREFGLKD